MHSRETYEASSRITKLQPSTERRFSVARSHHSPTVILGIGDGQPLRPKQPKSSHSQPKLLNLVWILATDLGTLVSICYIFRTYTRQCTILVPAV
jgi:hypothetical protein